MKRKLITFYTSIILIATLLVSACGFKLRGVGGDYVIPFKTIYVNTSTYKYFGAMLKRQIESAGAQVVQDAKQAEISLIILEQDREKEILSLSTAGRVREYALFYTFRFQVVDKENRFLLDPTQIRLRRTLTYSESQVYAKDKEEEELYRNMEDDVIQQVVQRLVDLKTDQTLSTADEPDL